MFIYLEYMFNVKQISFCLMSLLSNQVQLEKELGVKTESLPREKWDTWDPTLISEVQEYNIQINTKKYKKCIPSVTFLFFEGVHHVLFYWYSHE